MAAVYSKKQTKRRINLEKVSSENEKDSCVEESADSLSCEKDSSAESSSSAGRALSARSPEPEAREHAQAAAPLQIRIKEEPLEERDWPLCCEEKSEAFGNIVEHRREHTHDGPIVCLDTDSQWDNLLVSTDGGHRTLCCALCGCKFSNSREFFTHQLKHRNDIIKQESILETGEGLAKQKVFECKDCGKTYSSIGQCLNHQRSHKQASKSVFHQLAHLKKKSFQCPTCGRSYSRASALDAHRRCHEEKLFKSRNSEGEKHPADEVSVKTEDSADTSSEQLDESPKKLFECLDCGKSFRTMCGLGTHQRFSVNCSSTTVKGRVKRSFDCTECGKTFDRPLAMACHQRWHKRREQFQGNEQPLQCKECGKVFISLTFYNKHQRLVHSKEMPAKSFLHQVFQLQKKAFECQECGRRFSRASALQSHQLCHTDVFGDIMEGSSEVSSAEQAIVSFQNNQDKVAHFGGATAYSQNIVQTNVLVKELRHDGTLGTEDHKPKDDFKPIIIVDSNGQRCDHGSQQNPDLELVCESDQEEKDLNLNPCKETVLSSLPVDPEIDVNIVQVDCENFIEESGNTKMEQSPSQEAEKHECSECNRTFDKAGSLRCHMLWHRGAMGKKARYQRKIHIVNPRRKVSMKCEICGHESFTKASHHVHLGKHEDRKPYKSVMYQLANLQKNSFKCDVCGMHFSRLSALQSHQQHHNKVKKPYECLKCDKSYLNRRTLYSHQKVCSGKEPLNTSSHSDKDRKTEPFNPSKTLLGPKVHHCKQCGKGFWSMGAFFHHKQYHPQCADDKASSSGRNLKTKNGHAKRKKRGHKRAMISSQNNKPRMMPDRIKSRLFKCDVCDKSYRVIGCFLKHKLVHQNQAAQPPVKSFDYQVKQLENSMYSCPNCGKNFSRAMALQFHMRSHGYETGLPIKKIKLSSKSDGPHCPTCHVVFACESSLEIHQKHCLKAKGEQVEMCQEEEPDDLNASKEDKTFQTRTHEDVKDTSENVLKAPSLTSDLKYECDECDRSFSAVAALNFHKRIHCKAPSSMESQSERADASPSKPEVLTARSPFYCTECGRKFSTNSALGTHRRWHKDKKLARFILKGSKMSRKNLENGPFLCNLCGKGFFYLCVLRRHQKYHPPIVAQPDPQLNLKLTGLLSGNSPKSSLDCPDCDVSFSSGALLAAHFASHHAKQPEIEPQQQVREHPLSVQVSDQPITSVASSATGRNLTVVGDKPKIKYHCLHCNKKFINARGLRAHKWQKHRRPKGRPPASMNGDAKPFPCSWCEKCYRSQRALQNHQRTCSVNYSRFKLPIQPEAVEEQPLQHRPLESSTKCLFKCHKCGKAFPSEKQLDAHKETAKTRPHCCALCCRGYWTQSQLQQHLIWHDEVRRRLPTELRYRLNSSVVSGSLAKLHVSSTNLVSPAKPPSSATNLQITEDYKCHQCNKSFLSPHGLKEHQALHKSEEPYHCSLCPKTFAEIKDLIDHHQECLGDKEFGAAPLPAASRDTESLTCIECGISFNQETDLHQHYIDHARGEF
ncbi:zinc finger protein 91 isoform X2 [Neoarius graeffei]|uniref:zinc finger protein 91 isoform X2 n=1 Tax=Neoarius graeffei TaxID=443677 RepID=UPI00298D44B1|nr:zinc finger protein 91 isoform X2 [Neoarius graeffei]